MIKVRYSSLDYYREARSFRTLKGAQRYAQKWVGPTPEVSVVFQYAVSPDGIGKVEVSGACCISDLFPALNDDVTEEATT